MLPHFFRMHQVLDALPDQQARLGFPQHARDSRVGVLDVAVAADDDAVGRQVEEQPIALLRLAQGLLGTLARVNADDQAGHALGAAVGRAQRDAADDVQPSPVILPGTRAALDVELRRPAAYRVHERLAHGLAILRMHVLQQLRATPVPRRRHPAENALPSLAYPGAVGLDVEVPDRRVAALDAEFEPLLRLGELFLGTPPCRDVAADAVVADEAFLCVKTRLA